MLGRLVHDDFLPKESNADPVSLPAALAAPARYEFAS